MPAPKFDPNKPYKEYKPKARKVPKFDPEKDFEVIPELGYVSSGEDYGVLGKVSDVLDLTGSVGRAAVGGAIRKDETVLGSAGQQIKDIKNEGIKAVANAPTGEELLEDLGMFDPQDDGLGKTLAGVGAEIVTDPTTYINPLKPLAKLGSKVLKQSVKKPLRRQTAKALSHIENISKTRLSEGFDPRVAAAMLTEEDLVKHINNPSKLLEKLQGSSKVVEEVTSAGKIIKKGKNSGGLISEASESMKSLIDDVSDNMPAIKSSRIRNPLQDKYDDLAADITKGSGLEDVDLKEIQNIADRYLKPNVDYSVSELFELKKNLSKQINSKSYYQAADKAIALEKEVMMGIERQIDTQLKSMMQGFDVKGMDAAEVYSTLNNKMSNMIKTKNFLEMAPMKDLKNADLPTLVAAAGAKGLGWAVPGFIMEMAGVQGAGVASALGGVGFELGGAASKSVRQNAPAVFSKILDTATNAPEMLNRAAPQIRRSMRDDEKQRTKIPMRPQSMMSPQERLDLNIPKQLLQMKVPRDSQKIAENPKILEYKIAQHAENLAMKRAVKAGLDPAMIPPEELQDSAREIYENNKMVLNEMPDKIASMLPIWVQEMPELFEDDKYNRIDGVVPASMRMDVQEEIRKKGRYGGELSTHEMIAQLDELTSSGRYLGDKKDKGIA